MTASESLMVRANKLLRERGHLGLEAAQKAILGEKTGFGPLAEALRYFMQDVWFDFVHPGLMSLACEAAGGEASKSIGVGAAFVLLAGGADLHDDIIDQTTMKGGKLTVFGKFGADIALLAGDSLLFSGLYLLHQAVEPLEVEKRNEVLKVVKNAFEGISAAEANEASCHGSIDVSGDEYFEIIRSKVTVAEATAKIGAILGGGGPDMVELLAHFGQTFGILSTLRDEYIDVYDLEELLHRAEKECLPLPVLLAFRDSERKKAILDLLKQSHSEVAMEEVLDLSLNSEATKAFTARIQSLMRAEVEQTLKTKGCHTELKLMLEASLEDI